MLYEDEFDQVWESIIKEKIIKASELFGLKYKSIFLLKKVLNYRYNKYKERLVKSYMVINTTNIDRHKIAACLLKAILVTKPLYIPFTAKLKFIFTNKYYDKILNHRITEIDTSESIKKYFTLFNEYLAINIAVSVLNSYINSDVRQNRFHHDIIIPEPFPEPDTDYLLDVSIGLHNSKFNKINPITYANVLFLWEKYSCRKTQCDNIIKSFQDFLHKQNIDDSEIDKIIFNAQYGNDQ